MTQPTDVAVEARASIADSRWRELFRRRADRLWDPPTWLAALSVAAVAALYTAIVWGASEPVFRADEIGNIGNARALALGGGNWTLGGSGFMPGLGVLLAPAWWFTDDPLAVYRVGLALNVLLATLTVWPLSHVARYAGASPRGGVVIASVVLLAPARALGANYVLGETVTALATAAAAAAAIAFARRPTIARGMAAGLAAAGVFLCHGRGVAVAVVACAWALLWLRRSPRAAVALGASAALGSVAAFALYRWVVAHLYWNDGRVDVTFGGVERSIVDYAGTVVGMGWYATAAWPAIAVLGLMLLVRRMRWTSAATMLVGALVLTVVLAAASLDKSVEAGADNRLDAWIYGRYVDHLLTVVAVIGLTVLVRVRWAALSAAALGATVGVAAVFLAVTVPQMPVGGTSVDFHVPGVAHLLSLDAMADGTPEPWPLIVVSMVAISAVMLLTTVVRGLPLIAFALYFSALSVSVDAGRVDVRDANYRIWSERVTDAIDLVPEGAVIAIDDDFGALVNVYAFYATPRPIYVARGLDDIPYDVRDRVDHIDAVISFNAGVAPSSAGARRLIGGDVAELSIWVYPGPVADDLDRRGLLAPAAEVGAQAAA